MFVFCSSTTLFSRNSPDRQKCKVLLHLGNSIAFSVDKEFALAYDFLNWCPSEESRRFPPSTCGFSQMATAQKNPCAPDSAGVAAPEPKPAPARAANASNEPSDRDVPSPENLLQEYNELRARYQRTTNALGSAAHDLKTPLAILNGYVELLQSEKLGPVSDRQR